MVYQRQSKGTSKAIDESPCPPSWCRREISARCTIEAPAARVWELMTKVEEYGSWNPFIVQIDAGNSSTFSEGEQVLLHVRMDDSKKITKTSLLVTHVSPPDVAKDSFGELKYVFNDWFLASSGMVKSARIQRVQVINSSQCEYTTVEFFGGCLWRFIPFDKVQKGFDIHASSLKIAAEKN